MRLYRFIVRPKQASVAYRPAGTFTERLWPVLEAFFDEHSAWPNACYVSLRFPVALPESLPLGEGEPMQFRLQTLLADGEILLGVEIEADLMEGDDEQFSERVIG